MFSKGGKWNERRSRRLVFVAVALLCTAIVLSLEPGCYFCLLEMGDKKDPGSTRWPVARLEAMGPRAIGPMVGYLGQGRPWEFPRYHVLSILRKQGEPAHRALVEALRNERDPAVLENLIYTLEFEFHDFQFQLRWPGFVQGQPHNAYWLEDCFQVAAKLMDTDIPYSARWTPHLVGNGETLTPEFKNWYREHTVPHGLFPPLPPNAL